MFRNDEPANNPPLKVHPCLEQWAQRIDNAEKRGFFTPEEKNMASSWNMCVCGEARQKYGIPYDIIPLSTKGRPKDHLLRDLGASFFVKVLRNDFVGCRVLRTAIENRLAELGY